MSYNQDIAHCAGEDCQQRAECRRYALHLQYEQRRAANPLTSGWATYTEPLYDNFSGLCPLFMEQVSQTTTNNTTNQ